MSDFLSPEQIQDLERRHRCEKKKQPCDKIKSILLLNSSYNYSEIAKILLIDMTTIWRWHKTFTKKGLDGLLQDHYTGGTSKLTDKQIMELDKHLNNHVYLTAKEICSFVKTTFGVKYTPKSMTSLLHAMGYTYKKPKQIPGKATITAQQNFLEQYAHLKEKKAAEDRIYFMDATHL